jgi:cobyrinic acid a,c-diamide synthase
VDGLFIAGGFPETHLERLAANGELRQAIRAFVAADRPVYAECGGLMYLTRSIEWRGRRAEMVGAIAADCVMQESPVGRGYVRLRETRNAPWSSPVPGGANGGFRAHEFHYSRLVNLDPGIRFAYQVLRGAGIDGRHDGLVQRKLLASFAHLRDVESNRWTRRFVAYVLADKLERERHTDTTPYPLRQSV